MTIGSITSLQGLASAEAQFNKAAAGIASIAAVPQQQPDTVDLSSQAVALLQSRNSFEANVQALKVGDEMTQSLFNAIK